jgi:hypothetical protein
MARVAVGVFNHVKQNGHKANTHTTSVGDALATWLNLMDVVPEVGCEIIHSYVYDVTSIAHQANTFYAHYPTHRPAAARRPLPNSWRCCNT